MSHILTMPQLPRQTTRLTTTIHGRVRTQHRPRNIPPPLAIPYRTRATRQPLLLNGLLLRLGLRTRRRLPPTRPSQPSPNPRAITPLRWIILACGRKRQHKRGLLHQAASSSNKTMARTRPRHSMPARRISSRIGMGASTQSARLTTQGARPNSTQMPHRQARTSHKAIITGIKQGRWAHSPDTATGRARMGTPRPFTICLEIILRILEYGLGLICRDSFFYFLFFFCYQAALTRFVAEDIISGFFLFFNARAHVPSCSIR